MVNVALAGWRATIGADDLIALLRPFSRLEASQLQSLVDDCLRGTTVFLDVPTESDGDALIQVARGHQIGAKALYGPRGAIFEKYRASGRWGGVGLWLHRQEALSFVDDCRRLNLVIPGFDLAREQDGKFYVSIRSANYSSLYRQPNAVEASTSAAEDFLKAEWPDRTDRVTFTITTP